MQLWSDIDWDDLVPRLILYAHRKINRLIWRGSKSKTLPDGQDAQGIVQTAIAKTIAGDRRWKQEKHSLFKHLKDVIDSEISHLVNRNENRSFHVSDETIETQPCSRFSPEDAVLLKQEKNRLIDFIYKKDKDAGRLARIMLEKEIDDNIGLSNELGISVREVENTKKRLKRSVGEYRKSEGGYVQ